MIDLSRRCTDGKYHKWYVRCEHGKKPVVFCYKCGKLKKEWRAEKKLSKKSKWQKYDKDNLPPVGAYLAYLERPNFKSHLAFMNVVQTGSGTLAIVNGLFAWDMPGILLYRAIDDIEMPDLT